MSDKRTVRKMIFAMVTHNTVSSAGDAGKALRELCLRAGCTVNSGYGPESIGQWTLSTPADSQLSLAGKVGSTAVCAEVSRALTAAGCVGPYADHGTIAAEAARVLGCSVSEVLVSSVDRQTFPVVLSTLGASDATPAEVLRATTAWRASQKASNAPAGDSTSAGDSAPRVTAKRASAPRTVAAAAEVSPAMLLSGLGAMVRGAARQLATAFVVSGDHGTRGRLAIMGRELASLAESVATCESDFATVETASLRAEITVGASVTGRAVTDGAQVSGTVAKMSANAVTLAERDAEGDRIIIARDGAVASIDTAAIVDALSLWGFSDDTSTLADDTSAPAESSGSVDPTNIGAPPTADDVAAPEARAEADAASETTDTSTTTEAPAGDTAEAAQVDTSAPDTSAPLALAPDTSKASKRTRKGA